MTETTTPKPDKAAEKASAQVEKAQADAAAAVTAESQRIAAEATVAAAEAEIAAAADAHAVDERGFMTMHHPGLPDTPDATVKPSSFPHWQAKGFVAGPRPTA